MEKKWEIVTIFKSFISHNKEVMKYSASDRPVKLLYASAIVVESLALQMVVLMFIAFIIKKFRERFLTANARRLRGSEKCAMQK